MKTRPTLWLARALAFFVLASNAARTRAADSPKPNIVFILADDPGESKNLYAERPEIVARLTARLAKSTAGTPAAPR